jgi:glycosyltransferase involved in cell wall biosynthesis
MHAVIVSHAAIKAANRRVYRALAQRGCRVTLLIPDRWKSGLGPLRAEPEPPGTGLDVRVRRRYGAAHSNLYWLAGKIAPLLDDEPAAVFVDEDPAGFMVAQAARAASARRKGLVLAGIQNIYKRYPAPFEFLQSYVFKRATTSLSISEAAATTLRQRGYRGPSALFPFSTELIPLSPEQRTATRAQYGLTGALAGYVGRLVPEKGVDLFIDALATLPGVNGVIAGDGPERAALERRAAERGVAGRVTFTGVLAAEEAERMIGALDVLVLPSRTRPNWSEQFGRVLIEAMASGVAVVASDSGAIAEVVGDGALLFPEDDLPALAGAIALALLPEQGAVLRAHGLRRVRSCFTQATAVSALYDALAFAATRGVGTIAPANRRSEVS